MALSRLGVDAIAAAVSRAFAEGNGCSRLWGAGPPLRLGGVGEAPCLPDPPLRLGRREAARLPAAVVAASLDPNNELSEKCCEEAQ